MNILEGRIARAIEADRQGLNLISKDGKVVRTPGAVDIYELEVERLVKLRERLEIALDRREVAKKQRDHINKIYNERAKQYRDTLDRLISERARTEKYAKELRELQAQLHEALVNLADAGERNFQIEAEIRAIEMEYIRRTQPKGVKQP
jgi:intergrase/recombinase